VQGYLELLRELGAQGRVSRPRETELFIERACQSADELSEQLESLLQAAENSFSPAQLKVQKVAASTLAQRAIRTLDSQARRGKHRVRNQIPPDLMVLADPEALYRVFMNLLSNALKYSPEGRPVLFDGSVRFDTRRARPAASEPIEGKPAPTPEAVAALLVRDWGQGVAARDRTQLFERFIRLERDMNSPVRGSGLGLAICKELVTEMGGTIGVESEGIPGSGSTFWFTLPLASPTARAFQAETRGQPVMSFLEPERQP